MATTISEGFEQLAENLEITDLQGHTVSMRQKNVRAAVEADMKVLDSFLAGSYRRNTMIAPLKEADVDVFVVVSSDYYAADGQSALLDRVKRALKKEYPSTPDISRNGQAVTVVFTDFRVDVVPAFNRKDGGFLIPDSQRGVWISTDPKRHIELWTASNDAHDGLFIPALKMLKGWNKPREVFRSFHLEVLAHSVFSGITFDAYPEAMRYFFDKARAKIPYKLPDPAGYSDDVAAHVRTQEQFDSIVKRLDYAYEKSSEAIALADDDVEGAFAKWTLLFKDYFPAYG